MAVDEPEAKHEASVVTPLTPSSSDAEAADPKAERLIATDWTASDARGPLNAATPVAAPSDHAAAGDADATTVTDAPSIRPAEPSMGPTSTSGSTSTDPTSAASGIGASSVEPRRKASLVPVAIGIVVGALIGAGSAYAVYVLQADLGTDQKLAAMSARIEALPKPVDVQAAVQAAIAPMNTTLADLTAKVDAAGVDARAAAKTADAAKAALSQPAAANPDVAAMKDKIAALESTLAAIRSGAATTQDLGQLRASLADVQKQSASATSEVRTLQAGQKTLEGKVSSAPALAVAADSLISQIDRGAPFAAQVTALGSLDVDPAKLAVLKQYSDKGVLSAKALADQFAPLTETILSAETKPVAETGFLGRMRDGLSGLVSIRREGDPAGTDVPSLVARIKLDLLHGDVANAVKAWDLLPEAARTKTAGWGALAKAHVAASTAARSIAGDAIAALGSKKS